MLITEKILIDTLKNYRNIKQRIREIENVKRAMDSVGNTLLSGVTIRPTNSLHDSHVSKGPIHLSPEMMQSVIENESTRNSEYDELTALITLLDKMIMSLDEESHDVIETLYCKGYTYDRASEVLDISRATVTARRKRAIQNMMRMI